MIQKTIFEADGCEFATADECRRNTEKTFGLKVSELAHKLCGLDLKYTAVMDFIDQNLNALVDLKRLLDEAHNLTDNEGVDYTYNPDTKSWEKP